MEHKVFEIKITPKELKQIIENYFKEQTNKQVNFITSTKKEIQYYGKDETECAKTRYYLEQEIVILGITKLARLELSEEEIKDILKNALSKYEITHISFNSGFECQTQYEFKTPVFKEVKISLIEKKNEQKGYNSILDISDPITERPQSVYDPKNKGGYYEDWSLRRKF